MCVERMFELECWYVTGPLCGFPPALSSSLEKRWWRKGVHVLCHPNQSAASCLSGSSMCCTSTGALEGTGLVYPGNLYLFRLPLQDFNVFWGPSLQYWKLKIQTVLMMFCGEDYDYAKDPFSLFFMDCLNLPWKYELCLQIVRWFLVIGLHASYSTPSILLNFSIRGDPIRG